MAVTTKRHASRILKVRSSGYQDGYPHNYETATVLDAYLDCVDKERLVSITPKRHRLEITRIKFQ
jgi:hypothetical protein